MPGYTHLQRAQPVYLAHHLLAYFWMFRRDLDRFATRPCATADLPLGAGALAGSNWDTRRASVAARARLRRRRRELARRGLQPRLRARLPERGGDLRDAPLAVRRGDRALVERGVRLPRLGDSFTSGSSLMPQKKNPDAAELLRAKAPRVTADLSALLGVMHALPLAYNKDMQEDKEPLFDAVDTLTSASRRRPGCWHGAVSTARRWPAPHPTSSSRPRISPTCWCGAGCRSASRTRSSAGWCGMPSTRASSSRS